MRILREGPEIVVECQKCHSLLLCQQNEISECEVTGHDYIHCPVCKVLTTFTKKDQNMLMNNA